MSQQHAPRVSDKVKCKKENCDGIIRFIGTYSVEKRRSQEKLQHARNRMSSAMSDFTVVRQEASKKLMSAEREVRKLQNELSDAKRQLREIQSNWLKAFEAPYHASKVSALETAIEVALCVLESAKHTNDGVLQGEQAASLESARTLLHVAEKEHASILGIFGSKYSSSSSSSSIFGNTFSSSSSSSSIESSKGDIFYGIELSKPHGNTNGTVNDRCYFTCKSNYGTFLSANGFIILSQNAETNDKSSFESSRKEDKLKANPVSKWLSNIVKKPEYTNQFLSNGYDTVDAVSEMVENDLKEIGVKLPGHRKHIMKYIKKMQAESKRSDNDESEEDTDNTIRNACVICIAIEKYDNKESLPSVRDDVTNYKRVLGDQYHYAIYSSLDDYKDGRMVEKDVFKFINKCKNEIMRLNDDYVYETDYDAIIVSLSGHGTSHSFVTSDGTQIQYSKLRSRFNEVLEELPRIFCVDACRVFDNALKARSGHATDNGNLTVTIMGNTEGETVYGGKVSEYINKHLDINVSKAKWINFKRILSNAGKQMKKETKQKLILTEYDMGIDDIVFKPNVKARGHKYDGQYMNEKWEVWVNKNGNVNKYYDTAIKCNYQEKQIEFEYDNNKNPMILKKNTFKIKVDKGTVYLQLLDKNYAIQIQCKHKKPAKYWMDKMQNMSKK